MKRSWDCKKRRSFGELLEVSGFDSCLDCLHFSFGFQEPENVGLALFIEPFMPELASRYVENHELPQEDNHFFHGQPIFGVGLQTFGGQVEEVVPEEVGLVGDVV